MDEALGLQATDPGAANRAWSQIEQLVEEAAQGILLSRLWVQ